MILRMQQLKIILVLFLKQKLTLVNLTFYMDNLSNTKNFLQAMILSFFVAIDNKLSYLSVCNA